METSRLFKKMNKKGSVFDFFVILTVIFMCGIAILTAYIIIDTGSNIEVFQDDVTANAAVNSTKNTILNFDNFMMFIIVGLSLFVIISSAMVYNHPAFFIVSFILLCIAVLFAAIISNTFWTFTDSGLIAEAAENFPKILFLMERMPFYIAFMGIAASLAAYISYNQQ